MSCGSGFSLERSVLSGLCLDYDGICRLSTIDLNDHYENFNGDLVTGRRFYYSSRNVSIDKPARGSLMLKAELKGNHWWSGDFWKQNETDLSTCIVIRGGRFVFERQYVSSDFTLESHCTVSDFFVLATVCSIETAQSLGSVSLSHS